MARIQLTFPETFIYETEMPVRVSDLNYGGHLGHDAVLTIMQEARVQFYRHLGFNDEVSFQDRIGQVIADVAIQYKSEGFLGDTLVIRIAVDEITRYGFEMHYLITNKSTGNEVARGKTGIVCFDYATRKIAQIPAILKSKLS